MNDHQIKYISLYIFTYISVKPFYFKNHKKDKKKLIDKKQKNNKLKNIKKTLRKKMIEEEKNIKKNITKKYFLKKCSKRNIV